MKRYYVDLSKCSEDEVLNYKRILDCAFDTYMVAGRPSCYDVMWDKKEPLTDFIPSALIQLL